jgi:GDP-4-dehydro-6-deoxy-D-mannose reductase
VRALITGGTGFVGPHLAAHCRAAGDEVLVLARSAAADLQIDLRDAEATRRAVREAAPDAVYHLAAQAHVGRSWADPEATLLGNLSTTRNVLEAVRAAAPDAVVVSVSSGEVYGRPDVLPVTEDAPLRPQNPYAVSKAAADLLGGFYADAHGVRVVRARAFNHAGTGQPPVYALASFARQVAEGMAAGLDPVPVVTGAAGTRREQSAVEDVVRAYRLLAARGEAGVLNVCSGVTYSARELVALLGEVAGVAVEHVVDPALVRANEVPEVRGSPTRLRAATGWAPETGVREVVGRVLTWWQRAVADGRAGPT